VKLLAAVTGLLVALTGAGTAHSRGEITFTAETSHPGTETLYGARSDRSGLRTILGDVSKPVWSPAGYRFVFYSASSTCLGFCVANADGSHVRTVLRVSCGDGSDAAWSPGGRLLGLACTSGRSRVVVLRPDGTHAHAVAHASGPGLPQLGGLAWSPSGSFLVFYKTRSRPGRLYGSLLSVGASGGRVRKLAAVHGFVSLDERPSFSESGGTLAFQTDGSHFAFMDMATQRVTKTVRGSSPVFSPNGRRLALHRRGGEYVARTDASGAVRVCGSVQAVWSPDSRELAYIAIGPRVAVVGANGRDRRTITRSYADMFEVEWRP